MRKRKSSVTVLAAVCYALLALFVWQIAMASLERSIVAALQELLRDGWGRVTLIDLYAGFFVFSVLIIVLEGSLKRAWPWIVAIVFLGNLVTLLYVARRAHRAETLGEVFTPRAGLKSPRTRRIERDKD